MKTVAISGGFDPLHVGHLDLIEEAASLGDKLIVILNNDYWLKTKKGFVFMHEDDRARILKALKVVDEVVISFHEEEPQDMSVCSEIEVVAPDIFANGGDRKYDNVPEVDLCKEIGIETVWNVGGHKRRYATDMVKKAVGIK